jgi:DSBA-like thioredoxin domain
LNLYIYGYLGGVSTMTGAALSSFRLDIVSDTICPWCYVGKRRLAAALPILEAEGLTFDVTWRPFQLNQTIAHEEQWLAAPGVGFVADQERYRQHNHLRGDDARRHHGRRERWMLKGELLADERQEGCVGEMEQH